MSQFHGKALHQLLCFPSTVVLLDCLCTLTSGEGSLGPGYTGGMSSSFLTEVSICVGEVLGHDSINIFGFLEVFNQF